MAQTDHLGRETATTSTKAQTVTGFAVESGVIDSSAEGVQDTLREEERRRKEHTEHAERVSQQMAPVQTTERTGE